MTQKDLLRQQAWWQEFLAQYDFQIIYVRGEDNTIADALSRIEPTMMDNVVVPVFTVTTDAGLVEQIKAGYQKDEWCRKLKENIGRMTEASMKDGLLYWKERLIILHHRSI